MRPDDEDPLLFFDELPLDDVRPLTLFALDLDPPGDDFAFELLEDERDFAEPAVFEVPVLRDEVEDFAPPRDEVELFAAPLLLVPELLVAGEFFDAADFDVLLLFELVPLTVGDEAPRDDADDFDPVALDVPLFDDDFAVLPLPDEVLAFPEELVLPEEPRLPVVEVLLLADELRPDDEELLPDDELLRVPDELLRDELPPVVLRRVEPLVAPRLGVTISTAVDAAPTTAPVAAPPRRSVATSATFSMIVLTAESVERLDFLVECEAERL